MDGGCPTAGRISRTRASQTLAFHIALAALFVSRSALAAPLTLDLDWRAPSGCPDRNAVRRYVEEMLGASDSATSPLSARGGVARTAVDKWEADLTLRTASGGESTRSFEGPTCESVSRAAALVVALALHPNDAPPPPPPEKDTAPVSRPILRRFLRPEVAAGAAFDWGSTPGPSYGFSAAAGYAPLGNVRWEVFGALFAPTRATLANEVDLLGANISVAAFGLRGCYPVLNAGVFFAPCAGGGVDWLRASGFGARTPRDASARIATVQASGTIGWNLNELVALRLEVGAVIPITRPDFVIEGAGEVHRRAAVSLRGTAGLELHF